MMNWDALAQMLMTNSKPVKEALFHGNRSTVQPMPEAPIPNQATPAPEQDMPLEYMPPIAPAAPPLPTRKPMTPEVDNTQGVIPAGGFGATGQGVTGAMLERRLQGQPDANPFASRGTDYTKGLWPWQKQYWQELVQNASDIYNAPKPEGHDEVMMALSLTPAARLLAPIKIGAKALGQRQALERIGDMVNTRYNRAWARGAGTQPLPTPSPRQPASLAEELQSIHKRIKRQPNSQPLNLKPDGLLRGEALKNRRAYYKKQSKRRRDNQAIIDQLERKGKLDADTRRLLGLE